MRACLVLLTTTIFVPSAKAQQNFAEIRLADTRYRYLDFSHTFKNNILVDLFYIGVPGSNEINLGIGYAWKPKTGIILTPLIYGTIAKEHGQRGIKVALLANYEKRGWKINSFLAHNVLLAGRGSSYQVLDTLDITKAFGRRWEFGISSGLFHQDGKWNPQIGPAAKLNDSKGAWAISYRFGPQRELRLGRTFIF